MATVSAFAVDVAFCLKGGTTICVCSSRPSDLSFAFVRQIAVRSHLLTPFATVTGVVLAIPLMPRTGTSLQHPCAQGNTTLQLAPQHESADQQHQKQITMREPRNVPEHNCTKQECEEESRKT